MGLENGASKDRLIQDKISTLRQNLAAAGWTNSDFGFNLGRQTGAIDVKKDEKRFLFYPATVIDSQSYKILETHRLPLFPTAFPPIEIPEEIVTVALPREVRALDSMKFPDQNPESGYLGSFEIMDAIAQFLAQIYKKTGTIPEDLKLNKLGLISGNRDAIRLVPPLKLVPATDWTKVARDLKADLDIKDPEYRHEGQIEHLEKRFTYFLENENH